MTDPDDTHQVKGAERRREKRYEVRLAGQLGVDGKVIPVQIGDVSGSGALLLMPEPPETGEIADLWITGFGDVEVQVMFSGDGICGVMFTHPAQCRDRLLHWLMGEANGPGRA